MTKDSSTLTGEALLNSIRKTHRIRIVLNVLCILIAGFFLTGSVLVIRRREYVPGIFGIVFSLLIAWMLLGKIGEHLRTASAPEQCRLFRKYGSPESIAARIAAESGEPVISERSTILCRSFIMSRGDFETYVPLDQAKLIYRREHSTNGIKDAVYLVLYDVYGDKFDYSFRLGKKHKAVMEDAMRVIARCAPDCVVGYSPANVANAKKNGKPLE